MNKNMKGIFIPNEILTNHNLNITDKLILSIYKYYTEEGKWKCCKLTIDQISEITNISNITIIRSRKKLKELGYIETDNGIMTIYKGINDKIEYSDNFNRLLDYLPKDLVTNENIDYILSTKSDWVDNINKEEFEEINKSMFVFNFKQLINQK